MASVHFLGNGRDGKGRYRVFFCVDNKRSSKVIHAASMKQAEKQAAILEGKIMETGSIDGITKAEKHDTYLVDLAGEYMDYLKNIKENPVKDKTVQKYSDILKYQINVFFKGYKVSAIGVDEVTKFVAWMRTPEARANKSNKRCYSAATVKDAYTLLRSMLKYAYQRKYIAENPCDQVDTPVVPKREEKFYDKEQLLEMLRCLDRETEIAKSEAVLKRQKGTIQEFTIQKELVGALGKQLIVYTALNTACRRGEILGLTRGDINHENKSIHFCKEVLYTRGKGTYLQHSLKTQDDKTLFITESLYQMIINYLDEVDKLFDVSGGQLPRTDRLFMALRNNKNEQLGGLPFPDPYSEWFKLFLSRNNLPPITFHKLRHSSLSYLLNSGVPAIVIMKIAGHASLEQINKTYGHAWDSEKVEAAEKFEELFKKGSPNNAPQGLHTIFTPIETDNQYSVPLRAN